MTLKKISNPLKSNYFKFNYLTSLHFNYLGYYSLWCFVERYECYGGT
jgi:hypothetical protein